jgi:hypothetical protein
VKAIHGRILSVVLGTVAALANGAPGVAHAAEADESTSSDASALIDRGIALRRAGDDEGALPLFVQAEKLEPDSTRVLVHLAATYQALGQWEQADRYLTRALRDPSDPYVQKHQATLAAARRTVDGHIARLRLAGGPAGTQIRLNGKLIGTLPMSETMRVEAGIYTLEASLPGHYPVTRSVALAGGALAQESVELARRDTKREVAPAPAEPEAQTSGETNWLAWTFGGLAVGAAAGTVYAWAKREQHADAWNDNEQCLSPTQTRGELCGAELDAGEQAETWMYIGGAATAAFTAAAIGSIWLGGSDEPGTDTALSCGVGLAALHCAGRF